VCCKKRRTVFGKVHLVLDGDTVDVRTAEGILRIRLEGIDCPEDDQPWGEIAKAGLIKMIGGRGVMIELCCKDKYGRWLGTIFVKDKDTGALTNVNARMVLLGHAWVYRAFLSHLPRDRRGDLYQKERWARSRKVGLWSTDNPVPPWEWRNGGDSQDEPQFKQKGRFRPKRRVGSSRKPDYLPRPGPPKTDSAVVPYTFAISGALVILVSVAIWSDDGGSRRISKSTRPAVSEPAVSRASTPSVSAVPEKPAAERSNCLIKGNVNWRGERIYHMHGTPFYDTAVINTQNGERWFCSEQEALAAGWRASDVGQADDAGQARSMSGINPKKPLRAR
jgi:endonuclease YncB( thermonuclease family)